MPEENSSYYIRDLLSNTNRSSFQFIKDPQEIILKGKGKIYSKIIILAFKYKDLLKKIPLVNKVLINKKNKMLEENLDTIEVQDVIYSNFFAFVRELYKIALNRDASNQEVLSYLNLYLSGLSKEGIIYIVCSSKEFKEKPYKVKDIKKYKKSYRRYQYKLILKKIPVFGRLFTILFYPNLLLIVNDIIALIDEKIDDNNKTMIKEHLKI